MGVRRERPAAGSAATPAEMYAIPNRRMAHAGGEPAARVGDAASHRQPARSERPAVDVRVRIVHRRACGRGESRPGRIPDEAAHREHDGRQRVQAGAIDRVREGGGRGLRLGRRPSPKTGRHRQHSDRPRHRLLLPQPDRRGADRRGRSESQHRPRVGEAAGLRARLRAGHQPRGAAPHDRGRHAALAEPRALRRGAVRHGKGDERGLELEPHADACGRAGDESTSCW